jgi:uncharacterized short protein YbdD (DUF466 family)
MPSPAANECPPEEGRPARARVLDALKAWLAHLNGDEAYARYLAHWQHAHAGAGAPLSRAQFFREETARRWNGVRRCC